MKAKDMFLAKEFQCIIDNDEEIKYLFKSDCEEIHIEFRKWNRDYCITSTRWTPKDSGTWTTMLANNEFRNEFDKHCAKYGHWQLESFTYVNMDLLQAINQQMKEIGVEE